MLFTLSLCAAIIFTCGEAFATRISSTEFASFIDGFFVGVQRDWSVPGLSFVAVQDGQLLYKKGYGYTDLSGTTPVDPDKTMFRVGDISSVVTSIAVLQLAERGRVILSDDANNYLRKNKLPNTFKKPVTIMDLLTHTAGFDGKELETAAPSAAEERGFANRITKKFPVRFVEPGTSYARSSMGYALLGSIVERYSRQGFNSAVKRHIFTPLDMKFSTFSPSDEEMGLIAAGSDENGKNVPYSYRYDMAAVSMSTTAADMGNLIIALQNGGRLGRRRILMDESVAEMFKTRFSPDRHIDGACIGFVEKKIGGIRTLLSVGNIAGWSSFLILLPDQNFGMFCTANVSNLKVADDLTSAVVSRFFKQPEIKSDDTVTRSGPIPDDIIGSYRLNMIARHTAEKFIRFWGDQITVSNSDGIIVTRHTKDTASPERRWHPADNDGTLYVMEDEFGRLTDRYLFFERNASLPTVNMIIGGVDRTFEKVPWMEEHDTQKMLITVFAATFILSLAGTAFSISFNKGKMPWDKGIRAATELWTISSMFCTIQVAFMGGLFLAELFIGGSFSLFVPYSVKALFVIPLSGGVVLAWFCFRIFVNYFAPEHHWTEKIVLTGVAAIEVYYMVFLHNWRLLGFMF